jgi:hypothetical protein
VWGALRHYDLPDLVASLAPRSVWVVNSIDALGHRIRLNDVKKQYGISLAAFRVAGAENSIRIVERRNDESASVFYRDLK